LVHIVHGYDYAGNRLYRNDLVQAANSELYSYDNLGQIKSLNRGVLNADKTAVPTVNHAESWNFDKTGNWSQYTKNNVTENRAHNAANELQGIATHDANGNMVLMPGLKGKYDAWNRLVEVRDSNDNLIAIYEYNGLNQRIKKTVGLAVTKSFFNENWQEVESQTGSEITSYVWGLRYIDDLVLREKGTERLYSLADPNWNVVALVDASSAVVERMKYDAFGKITWLDAGFGVKANSDYNWNRTFTGQVLDIETELMLYRERYYHTGMGRFGSRDPIGYIAGIGLYRYVNNMPHVFVDPDGFDEIDSGTSSGGLTECQTGTYPLRLELSPLLPPVSPNPFFTVKLGVKVTAIASYRSCKKCCRGQIMDYYDERLTGSAFLRVEITVGADIDSKKWFGFFVKGYVSIRGEFGGEGTVSARYVKDECYPPSGGSFCVTLRATGTIRGGADLRVGYGNVSTELIAAEAFVQGTAGSRFCWKRTDGGWEYDPSKTELFVGRVTWGVRACGFGFCGAFSWTI
jgi:RHS repeat-associated protein